MAYKRFVKGLYLSFNVFKYVADCSAFNKHLEVV